MKTTNATFLTKQVAPHVEPAFKLYLFEQWDNAITDRDSATQIKISGDATSWLADGDVFIIPTDDFDTYHTITSTPSFGSGKTTIVCSGSTFGTDIVGKYVARKTDVTDDVLDQGMSEIRISTEGETLNSSLADDVQIALDNADETYWNSDGSSGLFNSGRIFWVQIIFYLSDDGTEFLVFGGTVYLPSIQPVSHLQTIEFLCSGHLKELERYPGFRISTENGILPKIPGIALYSIYEPTTEIIESLRDFAFKFPDGIDIKDLDINSISDDTPVGWHVIKFQPPDLFQYDFGTWTQKTAGATGETLTAAKGHTIDVDIPATFDIESREDWFYLKSRLNLFYEQIGKFSAQFSNGKEITLKPTFDHVIFYDDSGGTYTEIAEFVNAYNEDQTEIVGSVDDEIYFMTKEPISGIYFDLDTDLDGTILFYYSTNFNTYSLLAATDGTNDFSQSGAVRWYVPANHKLIDEVIDGDYYANYYIIKAKCTVYTSGSCEIRRALKHIQLVGDDNSKLNIQVKFEQLPFEKRDDKIILRDNSSEVMTPCAWKENYSLYQQLYDMLEEAGFTTANQSIDTLYITSATKKISLLGRPPFHHYAKKPTAMCVISSALHGSFKIYLGVEDELWSFDLENGYVFLDKLDPYIRVADGKYFKLEIRRLAYDDNDYLQGVAWKSYFDQPVGGADYDDDNDIGRRTPAVVFRSTDLATITEQNKIDVGDDSIFTSQEVCWRDGQKLNGGLDVFYQFIGAPHDCGENVAIPIEQFIWDLWPIAPTSVLRPQSSLESENAAMIVSIPSLRSTGHYSPMAQYFDEDEEPYGLTFHLGQRGFVEWEEEIDAWFFEKWTGTAWKISKVTYDGTVADLVELTDYTNQIIAGIVYNTQMHISWMVWNDDGDTWPDDYSDNSYHRIDNDGTNDTELFDFSTDSVEANQSVAVGDEEQCTIIDLSPVVEGTVDCIHGCILDRDTLEYHYFVYDQTNDKIYTSQTGTGFTFNANQQIKQFVFNPDDDKIYAVVVDLRNKQETAFLISAEFTPPSGSPDGTEITLTYEADLVAGEYDILQMTCDGNGLIFGITAPFKNVLFCYNEIIHPMIFLNDTEEDNFHDIFNDIAQAANMVNVIGPERKFYLKDRETNVGSMTITEADHYLQDTMAPIRNWNHRYDGVEVSWKNPLTGESGKEQSGTFGWQRRILKINNRFIQYPQLAKVIADVYADFYDSWRRELEFSAICIYQLECRDKFQFSHSVNRFDFSATTWWMINEMILNFWTFETLIRAIEIL